MPSDTTDRPGGRLSAVRRFLSRRSIAMLSLGLLAGASLGALDEPTVVLPLVGALPGWLLGASGLAVGAVGYTRLGGCGGCGDGCDCEGSCSIDG